MTVLRYDRRSIALHWLTAALVLALWLLGQTIDWFPRGDPRVAARSLHITLGVTLAVVLVLRLRWRLGAASAKLPPAGAGWLDRAGLLAHKLLYLLLAVTVLLGLANAWEQGDSIFGLFTIPAFDAADKALRHTIEDWHALGANVLFALAGAHAAAALLHHYVFKDDVLRRMLGSR
ncbi:MAG: cytochrome b/b6 domain-containing protein [Burkholderiales bacterium]|nr:cytochrome b/b6 domain-containing protein [Burkholderiales bacterium]MDE2275896.1 cytochrome b/b6 domain-containing protein [Burkholderiales bacterium]